MMLAERVTAVIHLTWSGLCEVKFLCFKSKDNCTPLIWCLQRLPVCGFGQVNLPYAWLFSGSMFRGYELVR